MSDGWRETHLDETGWLAELCPEGEWTGYDPGPRPDAAWILHAMYEWESGPTETTHQQVRESLLDADLVEPELLGGINLDEWGVVDTGGALGRSQHPGPGWRRLRWAELAARTDEPMVTPGTKPSFRSLPGSHPDASWPASIEPPGEGSLDREGWVRLLELLVAWSGPDTPVLAYIAPGAAVDQRGHVLAGVLGHAAELYDHELGSGSPANLWPVDRSWVTWSDWDLWGTKISGPAGLVERVLADPELEALRLPWA
ncbi:hypothetical protein ACFQY4_24345 [Catellatospora bangladeshensis]|uniref:Uncharacterized protein n=1 Tax=Catellatospora bangladeshensis TaxID=310355 RepID=A0A8J3J9I8_9ACTN|nr:hypothetical protein [Catellatospora bangladeshensis]GIF80106.1 hypothetical protein Cba03nite_14550 [Catellatospora bangladeshensis]